MILTDRQRRAQRRASTATTSTSNPADPGMDADAKLQLEQSLDQVGLGAWADFAWAEHLKGVSPAQILIDIRGTDLYKQKFPGLDVLRKQGEGWNEATYIAYENHAKDTLHFYGIPAGVFDSPQDLSKLMIGGVSATEFDARLKEAATALNTYSPEAMSELKTLYGVDQGGILAYALDPAKAEPVLAQQFAAAQIAGVGVSTGYGQIDRTDAETLAKQGLSADQAQQGFTQLGNEAQLFTGLPGQNEQDITQTAQLGAEFGGNVTDQQAIVNRQRQRIAQFGGGGQTATTAGGAVGLTTANT